MHGEARNRSALEEIVSCSSAAREARLQAFDTRKQGMASDDGTAERTPVFPIAPVCASRLVLDPVLFSPLRCAVHASRTNSRAVLRCDRER